MEQPGVAATLWLGVYAPGRLLAVDTSTGRISGASASAPGLPSRSRRERRLGGARPPRRARARGPAVRPQGVVAVGAGAFDVLRAPAPCGQPSYEVRDGRAARPADRQVRAGARGRGLPHRLASCGGRVWVGHGRAATWLTSIDPRTLRVSRIPVGATDPRRPRCIRGVVWVATPESVLRLDPPAAASSGGCTSARRSGTSRRRPTASSG